MITGFLFCLGQTVSLAAGPGPLDNPLKGFAAYCEPGSAHSCPVSMAFEETGWNLLEPEEGRYAFAKWEAKWDQSPAKGKPVVIRVYMDYPSQPRAVPAWLVDKGVKLTAYEEFGGGVSPDYANPSLQSALFKFIEALGRRYDRDPRVAYVQLGLLGHWGEWHTYPHENLFASPQLQSKVVEAMHRAFPHKPLMARNASYRSCQLPWLGFHDDMIPEDTFGSHDWEFIPAIKAAGCADNWKVAPTGGEMVPGAAKQYLGKDWDLLVRAVREAHFTWIGPYCPALEQNLTSEERLRADELIRELGYEYRLKSASMPASAASGSAIQVGIDGVNQGVAPFYYKWPVSLALLDQKGHVIEFRKTQDDIRRWLPGPFQINARLSPSVPPGDYRLALGILDPSNGKASIAFANKLETVDGYTVLGRLRVVKPLTN